MKEPLSSQRRQGLFCGPILSRLELICNRGLRGYAEGLPFSATSPAQAAHLLQTVESHLAKEDWSGLLYGIEALAQAQHLGQPELTALTVLDHVEIGQMQRLIYLRLGKAYWHQGQYTPETLDCSDIHTLL